MILLSRRMKTEKNFMNTNPTIQEEPREELLHGKIYIIMSMSKQKSFYGNEVKTFLFSF